MENNKGSWLNELLRTIIVAGCIALVFRVFLFAPFTIPSSSMVPGLLVGDFLFVSKYSYGYSNLSTTMGLLPWTGRVFASTPQRGDVVVFKLPRDGSTDYIKRLVGLPGDRVQMKEGRLYINGDVVPRTPIPQLAEVESTHPSEDAIDYVERFPEGTRHIIRENGDDYKTDNTQEFVVPPRNYFMMGDNRDNSADSRTEVVRFVPEDNLVGRAERLFFSMREGTSFWQLWKWPSEVRWERVMKPIE